MGISLTKVDGFVQFGIYIKKLDSYTTQKYMFKANDLLAIFFIYLFHFIQLF